ncbi:molybdopterin molybdotransferase MoeA [Roseovarius salinarum]|uniref:molybdopterin molybdotransferase MoeA n=1 Tax=Roseovarius salinarum TaxID=1981892 RepID=UPI000C349CC5|nr:gephyrin-like molybdotransferase Glp [Roseovarius salinarum]
MITVEEALSQLFTLVGPLPAETVPLASAGGRVLAEAAVAARAQPPFAASAMDGYAVTSADARPGARLAVVGTAAAGHRHDPRLRPGTAVRIFTGAPVPEGADRIVIQEDATRTGDMVTLDEVPGTGAHIRPAGADFARGARLPAPRVLTPADVALLAAMNLPRVAVTRKPEVALISTGDELVMPGDDPGDDQIIASNTFGLKALLEAHGAEARILPIAADDPAALRTAFGLAEGADLVVTIGGASVGDHDLVGPVAAELGMDRAFYKVAMRPGKPLMAGRMGGAAMIGLPGNPVSAIVCGHVFLVPVLRKMLGLGAAPAPRHTARLAVDVGANGPREHYMRATLDGDAIRPADRQDSALLTVLAGANALMIRPPHDPPRTAGDTVAYLAV